MATFCLADQEKRKANSNYQNQKQRREITTDYRNKKIMKQYKKLSNKKIDQVPRNIQTAKTKSRRNNLNTLITSSETAFVI